MEKEKPVAYLIPDFCRVYAISRASFYREVQAGRLAYFKRGRRSVIDRETAERWFENLKRYKPQLRDREITA